MRAGCQAILKGVVMLADWECCRVEFDGQVFVLRTNCSAVFINHESWTGVTEIGVFAAPDGLPDVQAFLKFVGEWKYCKDA